MRLTKFGHACVRIEAGDHALVLDPGMFTQPEAVDGATAVLITHEHPDHWTQDLLAGTDAPIFTIEAVRAQLPDFVQERVTVVAPGQQFDAGVPVTAVGELHAVIHPEFDRVHNCGYLLEVDGTRLLHPGDAVDVTTIPVDLLCLPVSAPWAKASDLVDYARAVGAKQNVAIHDRIYSEAGSAIFDGHLQRFLEPRGLDYRRLQDGEDL